MSKTYVITDLSFGDGGKGSATDYLSRKLDSPLVIRATSGPQAAHNVVLPNGIQHTFTQFGSGTFAGAETVYAGIVCDPIAAMMEADALEQFGVNTSRMITFSADSIVVTPYHQAANRLKEILRGGDRHGSCGMGINEAVTLFERDNLCIRVGDLSDRDSFLKSKVAKVREYYENFVINLLTHYSFSDTASAEIVDFIGSEDSESYIVEAFGKFASRFNIVDEKEIKRKIASSKNKIFEGAQGVLLDPDFGVFFPHVTRLSVFDVKRFLGRKKYQHVLCARTYMSRHGAGPFLSELYPVPGHDPHNAGNSWQGNMRYGIQDMALLRYSLKVIAKKKMLKSPRLFISHTDVLNDGQYIFNYTDEKTDHANFNAAMFKALKKRSFMDPRKSMELWNILMSRFAFELRETDDMAEEMGRQLGVPVGWISSGPTHEEKIAF